VESDYDTSNKHWEMQQQLLSIGEDKIHTDDAGLQFDPLAKWLFPIQRRLCGISNSLRRLNILLTWEDSYSSFWFTLTFAGLGVLLSILPTAWMLHWALRIAVYGLLGPWMKGFDLFILTPSVAFENEEERRNHRQKTLRDIASKFRTMSKAARIQGENAVKLKSVRKLRFGEFIARVPERNITRHLDYPLPQSFARLSVAKKAQPGWESRKIVPGQKLRGRMIQRRTGTEVVGEDETRHIESALKNMLQGNTMEADRIEANEDGERPAEEGIEITLYEPVARRRKKKKTHELRRIPEDEDESSQNDDDDKTMVSFMLIPSHITMPVNVSDDTSVTSSLGPDTSRYYDDLLEEESVEVIAMYKEEDATSIEEKGENRNDEELYFKLGGLEVEGVVEMQPDIVAT